MIRPESLVDHAPCLDCPQHRLHGAGCAVVESGARVALDAFLARDGCFLKSELEQFARRYLAHRPRSLLDSDDLAQEVASRLLADENVRRGGFALGLAGFLGYLRQVAVRAAITAERSERGRVRCGNCKHFAPYSTRCLKLDHAWTHRAMDSSQDPRRLAPPCRDFNARRDPQPLTLDSDSGVHVAGRIDGASVTDSVEQPELLEALHRALIELAGSHPRAALVVRARLLDGRTYEQLAGIGCSIRTMKRDFALGIAFLRKRLAVFAALELAPDGESGHSYADEGGEA